MHQLCVLVVERIESVLKNGEILKLDDFGASPSTAASVKIKNRVKTTGSNPSK